MGLKEDLDASTIKYIHDPYRMPGSRRTTPLSSTSTYARVNRPSKRLRKESVAKMTVKGIMTVTVSEKERNNQYVCIIHVFESTPNAVFSDLNLFSDYQNF